MTRSTPFGQISPLVTALLSAAALLAASARTHADILSPAPDNFALLSGGSMSLDSSVTIYGNVGSVRDMWIDRDSTIAGNAYTNASFSMSRNNVISGALVADKSIWIDRNSDVGSISGGGSVGIERDSVVRGDIDALGYTSIDRDTSVQGSVRHNSSIWLHNSVSVGGTVDHNAASVDSWRAQLRDTPSLSTITNKNTWYSNNTDTILTPGDYGRISTGKNVTIRLTAGQYTFKNLYMGQNSLIYTDTSAGAVQINIVNDLSVDKNVTLGASGSGRDVSITAGNYVYAGQNATINAQVISYGRLDIDKNATITGNLYSHNNMWIGSNSTVTQLAAPGVPEPATALLLIGAAAIVSASRRERSA